MPAILRRLIFSAVGAAGPFFSQGEDTPAGTFKAHKIPMIVDPSGGFLLAKAKADDKNVRLLIDSGALLEFAMTKKWATGHGKELKNVGSGAGITRLTDGYYFVETKINDKSRWMCLDSVADTMLIDNSFAKEDGIELIPGPTANGIDGKVQQASSRKLRSFSIGTNTFEAPTISSTHPFQSAIHL